MDNRMTRQTLLIPDGMKQATVVLVGLGMLGSWTAHVLARTCRQVIGFDFDTVDVENIGTQAYDDSDVGIAKASALWAQLRGFPFVGYPVRFEYSGEGMGPEYGRPLVVVSAVDSFAGRRMVAEWAAQHADLFIDTRAHGTVGVVITVPNAREQFPEPRIDYTFDVYLDTLESDDTAPAPACGAEGTAFVGQWVASQVASSILRYFRGLPVAYKVVRDVAMDMELSREEVPMAQPQQA